MTGEEVPEPTAKRAPLRNVRTDRLDIAYEEHGSPDAVPIVLLHGFPDDVRAWDDIVGPLVDAGYRTLAPYLRGYGSTRFRDDGVPRSGQQAALGQDVIDFADALGLDTFVLVGHDWGALAADVVGALYPWRVRCLISMGGYLIYDPASSAPAAAILPALWYQWYFNLGLGKRGFRADRRAVCRLLWQMWSPGWRFDEATFERTAASFENPDFVEVVTHMYRHRRGTAPGDPRYDELEAQLSKRPAIAVPTAVLHGEDDGVAQPVATESQERFYTGPYTRSVVRGVGHFLHRERPTVVVDTVLTFAASHG